MDLPPRPGARPEERLSAAAVLLLAGIAGALPAGCSAKKSCTRDSDCATPDVCASGTCVAPSFAVGAAVNGLDGSGLSLQLNGAETLHVSANGFLNFTTTLATGASYVVTVSAQPTGPEQGCVVLNGQGTIAIGDVTDIVVSCATNAFTVGGHVTGLSGAGLLLLDNGGDALHVTSDAFTFATPLPSGDNYAVSVLTQPTSPSQTCTVSSGSGTISSAAVASVAVACTTNTYTLGGTVTGLSGSGLVLQNASNRVPVSMDGPFSFTTPVLSGAAYQVTVATQPSSPSQICTVLNGSGSVEAGAVTVSVVCETTGFTIGGMVTGLTGTGLILALNGEPALSVSSAGAFTLSPAVASEAMYAVTVATQPTNPPQTCSVTMGSGTVGAEDVTDVAVSCVTDTLTLGGTVTGLAGTGLILTDGAGDMLPILANGPFTLQTAVASGQPFSVTVATQPSAPTQLCSVLDGAGMVGETSIQSISVNCATSAFTVGGQVSGLLGSGLVLQDNAGDALPVPASGSFLFPTALASGAPYSVTVRTQPSAPSQTCVVTTDPSGTIASQNISDVAVQCTTNSYTVSVNVLGLEGTGLKLQNNVADNLAITGNGLATFATAIDSQGPYSVTVLAQPTSPTQSCTVSTPSSGTVTNTNVTGVVVTCTTTAFPVSVAVTGLAGSGLVLQDDGGDNLPMANSGAQSFSAPVASGEVYAVTVLTQPTSPTQICTVTPPTGIIGGAGVTVAVSCTTQSFAVTGTISGLTGNGLVLANEAVLLPVAATSTSYAFPSQLSDTPYAVSIKTQPSSPTENCVLSGTTSGQVATGNVTGINVSCTVASFALSASVTGLTGGTLQLENNGANVLTLTSNVTSAFNGLVTSGATYNVTVSTQPAGQFCAVASPTGTVTSGPVTVTVSCVPTYTVGGTLAGLTGTVVLQDNGGDNLSLTAASSPWTFSAGIADGSRYDVTVLTQPAGEICFVDNDQGTVSGANVSTVFVQCAPATYSFTTCAATGPFGPTQAQCTTAYASTSLAGSVTVPGAAQTWTVPISGTWLIVANGAQGAGAGGGTGGLGAQIEGEFNLTAGTVLQVVVGQEGTGTGASTLFGGGGGGSFVQTSTGDVLVIAGGGGGASAGYTGGPGQSGATGGTASGGGGVFSCPAGGTGGVGGGVCTDTVSGFGAFQGAGGGGYSGSGTADVSFAFTYGFGGAAYTSGATGGQISTSDATPQYDTANGCATTPAANIAPGGFGGGGSGNGCSAGGGGGGGLNGGVGGLGGGGGGSFDSGITQTKTQGGAPAGSGSVTLTLL